MNRVPMTAPMPPKADSPDGTATAPPRVAWPLELEPAEVRARLRWARRQGHPRYLWPDVPVAEWRSALRELESVVAAVLRGDPARIGCGAAGVRALGVAGFTSGVGPLVGRWVEEGRVDAPDPLAELYRLHLWHGRERAARQARDLERVIRALSAEGIQPLVVKSAHIAREYYPDAGARPAVDVDVVVPAARFTAAERALRTAGYLLAVRQHRPPKSDWLPPGVEAYPRSLELLHAGSQYGVDLQASLDRNFFGVRTVRPAAVESAPHRRARGLLGSARVLDQPVLLAYQALHASEGLHATTLIRLVDLVLIARRDTETGRLDWDALGALLERSGGERFAYPALALVERLAPGTIPCTVLGRLERAAPRRMRTVVAAVSPATAQRPDSLSVRERFMWCATPGDHLRRLVHMLVPAPAGRSVRRLAGHYVERAYRIVRGRVRLGGVSPGTARE